MVHESVGFLDKLRKWGLAFCDSLQNLPNNLRLKSLEDFYLSSCSMLEKFPNILHQEMKCLKRLQLSESGIRELPSSIGYLTQLTALRLERSHNLRDLPDSIGYLTQLTELSLHNCHNLRDLPESIGYLTQLTELSLHNCHNLRDLPDSIGYLTQLTRLWLRGCHNLRDLPDSIYKLQMLEDFSFDSAKLRPPCNSFDGLSEYGFLRLRELRFSGYRRVELEFLMKPNYFPVLSLLDLSGTDIVSIPESLNRFTTLETLLIRNCQQLRQILGLPQFIRNLNASHCRSLDAQSSSRLLNQVSLFQVIIKNKTIFFFF